jgi:alkylation response protein AidB-like acyl-CoA dehydrogenase
MDLSFGPENEAFRETVKAFLAEQWRPEGRRGAELGAYVKDFRTRATEAGFLYRGIPKIYGGSEQAPDVLKAQVIRDEFALARAPGEVAGNGMSMLVPTLLALGTDWQKAKFIPPTVAGDYLWGQGYSEPGSGSDLASVRTKGVLEGDHWVINGQKIWTSGAQYAHYMFALIRTEPDAPKHQGISYLLIDLHAPGVTVRPLRQMTGGSEFCEVFFDNARTPADWIVGKRGEGWQVSKTTLKHERASIGNAERSQELVDKLVGLARETTRFGRPAIEDREIRQDLAALEGWALAHKYSAFRQFSLAADGRDAGLIGLVMKLMVTDIGHEAARIAQELIAEDALLQPAAPGKGAKRGNEKWVDQIMGSLGVSIAGGASNIQRNIIAERGLGLPREPAVSGAES